MTYADLPANASPYYGDPVATSASLPATGSTGELRVVLDTDVIYEWNGSAWQALTSGTVITGPASSTDNAFVRWDGTGGTTIQNSTGATLDDSGNATLLTATIPTVRGSVASGGNLALSSTSHATKGKVTFGTSAYDEVNNRLGVGNATPAVPLDVTGAVTATGAITGGSVVVSGTSGNVFTADTNVLVVDATNNRVGVNNASPAVALDVTGAVTASSTVTAGAVTATGTIQTTVATTTTDGIIVKTTDNNTTKLPFQVQSSTGSVVMHVDANGSIKMVGPRQIEGTTDLRLAMGGNVRLILDTSGTCAIGDNASNGATAQCLIISNNFTTRPTLRLKGSSSQTADLLQCTDNSNVERFIVEIGGTLDISGITAGTPNFRVTATSDTPSTTYTAHVASTDPAGYIEIDVGGSTRYIPFFT